MFSVNVPKLNSIHIVENGVKFDIMADENIFKKKNKPV